MSLRSWIRRRVERVRAWIQRIRAPDPLERQVAVHEAGHVLAAWLLPSFIRIKEVTVLPMGDFRGYTLTTHALSDPPKLEEIVHLMTMSMAGAAAERLVIGSSDAGSGDDMIHALAWWLFHRYGMSIQAAAGISAALVRGQLSGDPLRRTRFRLFAIPPLAFAAAQAVELLRPRIKQLMKLADALRRRKALRHEDIAKILGPRPAQNQAF